MDTTKHGQLSCKVDMKQLADEPYNLGLGDDIYYRIRASNLVGMGEWSVAMRNGQRQITKPGLPIAPKID